MSNERATSLQISLLEFGISVIQSQKAFTTNKQSSDYLSERLSYFENLAESLKGQKQWVSFHRDVGLLYIMVENYYNAYNSIHSGSSEESTQFYLASVAQLKDELWEIKSKA